MDRSWCLVRDVLARDWIGVSMGRLSDRVRRSGIIHNVCVIAAALCIVSLLASCNAATTGATAPGDIDVLDKVRSVDIMPRQAQGVNTAQPNVGERGRAAVFEGTEITEVAEARPQSSTSGGGSSGGYDLNFENTPIATVAKVMIGDILNTGYIIDPRVQGTVSLVSVRPVPKSDIVFVLENALRISGVVLLRDSTGYRLTPRGDAVGAGQVDSVAASPEPGYGVSVVPLQYVSAQTLLKLMDSFATKAGSVRADAARNLLLIQGTGPERRPAFRLTRIVIAAAIDNGITAHDIATCLDTSADAVRGRITRSDASLTAAMVRQLTGLSPVQIERRARVQLKPTPAGHYLTSDIVRLLLTTSPTAGGVSDRS